jgi:hypothetical protein
MDQSKKIIMLTHKEVIDALIKHQNLHDGIWQLYVEFGISGGNVPTITEGTQELRLCPAAIVPINKIGLAMVDKENPLALDASKVNPPLPEPNA